MGISKTCIRLYGFFRRHNSFEGLTITKYTVIISGKGGVGKTTTTVNLGLSLHNLNQRVVAVDTNLVTPNLALQLGLPPTPITLHNVLRGEAKVLDTIQTHATGLNIIPAGLTLSNGSSRYLGNFREALEPLKGTYDHVLMDCGAGLWGEVLKSIKIADEAIIVTNPELPALVDALKAIKISEKLGVPVRGIVVTKCTGANYELKDETIRGILKGYPILIKVPFDQNIPRSISMRKPLVSLRPNSRAARAYKKLAAEFVGAPFEESFFQKARTRLFGW
ncbi:MAG: cell division ATPase MinD [archaeon]